MKYRFLAASGSVLMLIGAGCSEPYSAPEAMITQLDAAGSGAAPACSPMIAAGNGRIGRVASFTGRCSSDPQNRELAYHWSLVDSPSGSVSDLGHSDLVTPTFMPDLPGTYRLRLVVSNGVLTSQPAEAELVVSDCGDRAPIAAPSASTMAPFTGQTVQLDVGVSDEDVLPDCAAHGDSFQYAWSFVELPSGSAATLNDPNVHDPSFIADAPGAYRLRILVTDPTSLVSETRELQVTAAACGDHAPVITSIDSSPSAAPANGDAVQVSPTFTDADLDAACQAHAPVFTYSWQLEGLPPGSSATLNQPDAESPSFTPDVPGDYRLRLVITDPTGRSTTRVQTITASDCGTNRPVATATATPSSGSPNDLIQLQGAATDADLGSACGLDESLSYAWRWIGVPAGSDAMLTNPRAQLTGFHPDVPGTYTAELVVTDSRGLASDPVQAQVTVDDCGLARPIAAAQKAAPGGVMACGAAPIAINLNTNNEVLLDASPSSDPDNGACNLGQTLFYSWSLLTTPLDGGGARLRNATGQNTVLDVNQNGEYRVRLIVTDSTGRASQETTCILQLSNVG